MFAHAASVYARQNDDVTWIHDPWSQETLAELAELAGLDRSFVGAIERCEHNTTLATVEKLANAFDRSVAELLTAHRFST